MQTTTRKNKQGIRILPTAATHKVRAPRRGDYVFESRTHMLYTPPTRKFSDAQVLATAYLATHGHDTEIRFRGVHQ